MNTKKANEKTGPRQLVVKSNDLINASYRLNLNEQRLILLAISKVRRDQPITESMVFTITPAEFSKVTGVHPKTAYRELADTTTSLYERRLLLPGTTKRTRWVQTVDYEENQVIIRFAYDVSPHLTELKVLFTQYDLKDVRDFNSVYSFRIYELVCHAVGVNKKSIYFSVDEIRDMFMLGESYKKVTDLAKYVIADPIKEINEKSSKYKLSFDKDKRERRVVGFRIKIEKTSKVKANKKPEKVADDLDGKAGKKDRPLTRAEEMTMDAEKYQRVKEQKEELKKMRMMVKQREDELKRLSELDD